MVQGKAAKRDKPRKAENREDDSLLFDVRREAARLGLPAAGKLNGGNEDGFDDRDFRSGGGSDLGSDEDDELSEVQLDGARKSEKEKQDEARGGRRGKAKGLAKGERREWRESQLAGSVANRLASPGSGTQQDIAENGEREDLHEAWQPWYEQLEALGKIDTQGVEQIAKGLQKSKLHSEESKILSRARDIAIQEAQREAEYFMTKKEFAQDVKWLQKVKTAGTFADKIAALSVLVQRDVVANLDNLDLLMSMACRKSAPKRQIAAAMEALKELYINCILPDTKLRAFERQDVKSCLLCIESRAVKSKTAKSNAERLRTVEKRRLLLWYAEDLVKKRYASFVETAISGTVDLLDHLKQKSVRTVFELLMAKPEQEKALLTALVNKLGDPSRKLASKVGFFLHSMLSKHPLMKAIVAREVEGFIFRPNVGLRATYYAIVFLNQIVHSHKGDGPQVAEVIMKIYFDLFRKLMNTGGEKGEEGGMREVCIILETTDTKLSLFETLSGGPLSEAGAGVNSKLLGALLTGVNRAFPYLQNEEADKMVDQNSPVLYRMAHISNFSGSTQALTLLFQCMASRDAVDDRFFRALYAKILDPELMNSTRAPMFLALVLKAVKTDVSKARKAAFVKRLLQIALQAPSNLACGIILLVSEILKTIPGLWSTILDSENEIDETETFKDKDGITLDDSGLDNPEDAASGKGTDNLYDPYKRDPLFTRAERTGMWELCALASHMHPSVAAMARTLLAGQCVTYGGNPLQDMSVRSFLDKFVNKKPKRIKGWKGSSLMQPTREITKTSQKLTERLLGKGQEALDVAPTEVFFHQYQVLKGAKKKKMKKKSEEILDLEDEEDEAFDEEGFFEQEEADEDIEDNLDEIDDFIGDEEDDELLQIDDDDFENEDALNLDTDEDNHKDTQNGKPSGKRKAPIGSGEKPKKGKKDKKKTKKRQKKSEIVFASADDYAHLQTL